MSAVSAPDKGFIKFNLLGEYNFQWAEDLGIIIWYTFLCFLRIRNFMVYCTIRGLYHILKVIRFFSLLFNLISSRQGLCTSGSPGSHYVDQDSLRLIGIFLSLPTKCEDYRSAPHSVFIMRSWRQNFFCLFVFWEKISLTALAILELVVLTRLDSNSQVSTYLCLLNARIKFCANTTKLRKIILLLYFTGAGVKV